MNVGLCHCGKAICTIGENDAGVPAVGETWHILRHGATACATVKIVEVTLCTVLVKAKGYGSVEERLPLDMVRFVEKEPA